MSPATRCAARSSPCPPPGPAAPAGGGRQPGRQGAQRDPARRAGPPPGRPAPGGDPPDRHGPPGRRARPLRHAGRRGRGPALHRGHGPPPGRLRPDRLPRRRDHRQRAVRRGRRQHPGAAGGLDHLAPARQRRLDGRARRRAAPAPDRTEPPAPGRRAGRAEPRAPAGHGQPGARPGPPRRCRRGGRRHRTPLQAMKHAVKHIHFVGEGGAGMSGIAEILHNLGYTVSGSDKADSPEVIAARARRVPVVPRAVMLAELMRLKRGIAIAGTHGKTTTTSLVTSVLAEGGLDPTFVIGGRLNSAGANARLGQGDYIVVEADESDASLLNLLPVMAVGTNLDADHMETYGHDFARLKKAFVDFLHRMPFYGTAILFIDNPAVREIVPEVSFPITIYGFSEDAQVRAVNVRAVGAQMHFTVQRRNGVTLPDLEVVLNLAGEHNVLNALSAIAVAVELNIPDEAVLRALASFRGVGRRFQGYGDLPAKDGGRFTVIDDYGHHPVEMAATLAAARGAFAGRRLVLAFQPHRYTRTRDCFEDFVKVIGSADAVLLTEVYAAGEAPVVAADGRSLARALRVAGRVEPLFVEDVADLPQAIAAMAQDGDVVLCMGAGSIGLVPGKVVDLLQNSELAPLAGKAQ